VILNASSRNVGILYPGEMGAAIAALLMRKGMRVVTSSEGRSAATARRAREFGCVVLDSMAQVIAQSHVVISVVPPDAAEEAADAYCALARHAPADAIYVDANSISPELATVLASRVTATGRAFVDAAINGLAKNLAKSCTLFLSGSRSGDIAELFVGLMRVRTLGDEVGRASAIKMLLSGMSKGVCALFAETALVAHRRGMLKEMLEAYTLIYPGLMELVQRMFPTYAKHSPRRAAEMRELESSARASGIEPSTIIGARELHEQLAAVDFSAANASEAWTAESMIDFLVGEGFLELMLSSEGGCHGQ
jgi:3-hydroxyisobutyrate dehydrogenase-like beta-hydroxyacid dehydrogenase